MVRWLALLPFLGMLVGPFFLQPGHAYALGMRSAGLVVAWISLPRRSWQ